MGGKVTLRCKGKTLLGDVNKLFVFKSLFTPQTNFPDHDLNFHWRWRWWDWIQATFKNIFYFKIVQLSIIYLEVIWRWCQPAPWRMVPECFWHLFWRIFCCTGVLRIPWKSQICNSNNVRFTYFFKNLYSFNKYIE